MRNFMRSACSWAANFTPRHKVFVAGLAATTAGAFYCYYYDLLNDSHGYGRKTNTEGPRQTVKPDVKPGEDGVRGPRQTVKPDVTPGEDGVRGPKLTVEPDLMPRQDGGTVRRND